MERVKAQKVLNPKSVWLPVVIGISIVVFLAYRDDQFSGRSLQLFSDFRVAFLLFVFFLLLIKDGLNAFRIRLLSHGQLNGLSAIRIVLLWEFAIAVTPPVIGAAAVLVFIVYKEGQPLGKALAYTLLLAILDNLFFLTASPLAIGLSNGAVFPILKEAPAFFESGVSRVFWLSYTSIAFYTFFMLSALLFFPETVKKILTYLMTIRVLRRWKEPVVQQSEELVLASKVLRGQSPAYWVKLLAATYAIWIFKFALINAWVSGFNQVSVNDQLLMLGRHLTMWVVMLVSPSPGNAGTAEFIFPVFYEDFAGKYTFISGLLWRLTTYYPYLIAGVLLIPKWWKK